MIKHKNKFLLLSTTVFILSNLIGCSSFHIEIPITTVSEVKDNSLEEISRESENHESEDTIQQIIAQSSEKENLEEVIEDVEIEPIGSFEILDDARICKNLNFDMSNKLVSVYDVVGNTIVASSAAVDRTKKDEVVLNFKTKDSNFDVWVYANINGSDKLKPWEPVLVNNNLISRFTPVKEGISGNGFSGSYIQLDEIQETIPPTEAPTDGGEVVEVTPIRTHKVYNDTYASKVVNDVLISVHISGVRHFSDENYSFYRIINDSEIERIFEMFTYVDSKEVQVVERSFNFENTLRFSQHVVDTNLVSDLPYSINERVVAGGETISGVEIVDKPGCKLQVRNSDNISKSVKQCEIVSLTYDFLESSEYDCVLFDYLVPNSGLDMVDTIILNYDNYYIDSNGTGYVTYNLDKDNIKSVTTYYVQNRLAGLVVEFN